MSFDAGSSSMGASREAVGVDTSLLAAYGVDESIIAIWSRSYPRLLPIQVAAVTSFGLFAGENILIFAPTSSGKTFVGEMAAVAAAKRNRRAIYLLPLKSLAEEKYEEFTSRYARLGIKVVVSSRDRREHDRAIEKGDFDIAIVVFEKMDALLLSKPALFTEMGLVVVDELQMLCDPSRGPRLELLLAKILVCARQAQIIGLSAVLEKSQDIRDWIGAELLQDQRRPVELYKGVFHRGEFHYVRHNDDREGIECFAVLGDESEGGAALALVEEFARRGEQTIVFLRDKTSTIEMARLFAERGGQPPAEIAQAELRESAEASPSTEVLISLLSAGVAFHNADLSRSQRRSVEAGFRRGEIRAVFCTTTLGMGVNLPARNVIIDAKRWSFSKEFQQVHLLDIAKGEYENLGGRAGRLSHETEFGRSILIASSEFEQRRLWEIYVKGGYEESAPRLDEMPLDDIVLNLLGSRISRTMQELQEFLLGTFTGRNTWSREFSRGGAGSFTNALKASVRRLADVQLVQLTSDDNVSISELGNLVSRSCIQARTGTAFSEWARRERSQEPHPLEVIFLLAQTGDASSVYVPLARSEWMDDRYFLSLKDVAGESRALLRPSIKELLDAPQRPSFEMTRAMKRTLMVFDWINEVPLGEIEERHYQAWPGLVQRVAETDSWLCESLSEICRFHNWPASSLNSLATLTRRLSCGLLDDALSLGEQIQRHATRAVIRRLVGAGVDSMRELKRATSPEIADIIGHPAAARLAPVLTPGPTRSRSVNAADAPSDENRPSIETCESIQTGVKKLVIDARNLRVKFGGLDVVLTPKCFKLLMVLCRRPAELIHKEEIYEALWG
ncbi:MAG: DEAD/DEAH box helicase, partial [Candidatus Coatesbacteria bacterium]|nr:DEAD/DEAH box helicase [Candidatus Coatesbacteria bacterium]